ncbi:MAG TPA: L-histidine N(alpha)-methyltransferase [Candidatus Acidoferrum sp.]
MSTQLLTAAPSPSALTRDVCRGLFKEGQKEIPSKYLYDSVGSALFEVICHLPEYGVTRAEGRILARHAGEIVSKLPSPVLVAELGSGTGKKTRLILEALCHRQPETSYHPIEISRDALVMCQRELGDIHCISIVGMEREYLQGLQEVVGRRQEGQHLMVLFLGGTIGNFDGTASIDFLSRVRSILHAGDSLLLGTDMLKPISTLIAAYDDPLGVTAAFNRNLLVRLNREIGTDFDLAQFEHAAIFNEQTNSIEMHLRSRIDQTVTIPAAAASFDLLAGETIWTETSHKHSSAELIEMARKAGFHYEARWVDQEWAFAENLWIAA